MKDSESTFYFRGVLLFLVSTFAVIAIGLGVTHFFVKQTQPYRWAEGPAVLPVSSTRPAYPLTSGGESPFVAVVEKTRDAVVFISAEGENPEAMNIDPMWRRFLGIPPRIASYGSGFLIRPDGYILTNNHVVAGGDKIMASLSDKRSFQAKLVGADAQTDLAVLKIDTRDSLPFIELGNSDSMRIGDWVVAIGNPFPEQGLDRTVTVGVVSAKSRHNLNFGSETPTYQDYIQTDASINPGNSGGPLVNLSGEAIGINSAIASPNRGSVGIGFAIPSNLARVIVSSLIEEGKVARGWLGVNLADLTPDQAEASGLSTGTGVLVSQVMQGSPAQQAGLRPNDIVMEFDGQKVSDVYTLRLMVAERRKGDRVAMRINRDGHNQTVNVVLGDRDRGMAVTQQPGPEEQPSEPQGGSDVSWLGMTVETCSPSLAARFNIQHHPGAIVVAVEDGSPAAAKGILPGTIITKIDFRDVRGRDDFARIANELKDRTKAIAFYIFDLSGNIGYVALKPE